MTNAKKERQTSVYYYEYIVRGRVRALRDGWETRTCVCIPSVPDVYVYDFMTLSNHVDYTKRNGFFFFFFMRT